jgi:hypothetical protein
MGPGHSKVTCTIQCERYCGSWAIYSYSFLVQQIARPNQNRSHNGHDHISTIGPGLSVALYHCAEGLSPMDICDNENNRRSLIRLKM